MSEFDIQYRPWMAIKGQVVADFITKFTLGEGQVRKRKNSEISIQTNPQIDEPEEPA